MVSSSIPIITVIGSLNIDLVTNTPRVPKGGETLHASSFYTGSGGKGANQAVACAKLSRSKSLTTDGTAKVNMIGAVGDDTFGSSMVHALQGYGVNTDGVQTRKGKKTGVAVIIVEETTGENRILLSPGANFSMRPEQFQSLPSPKPDLIILQLEIPLETVKQIVTVAAKEGVSVLLNPAPAVKLSDEVLGKIRHLIVNETEAATLSGCDESVLANWEGLEKVAERFKKVGVNNVIITLGGRGVFYAGEGGSKALIPARKAKVVDTTAAGDTFVGAYALEAVKKEFDISVAVEKANMAAALTVERMGAQESIPWEDELV